MNVVRKALAMMNALAPGRVRASQAGLVRAPRGREVCDLLAAFPSCAVGCGKGSGSHFSGWAMEMAPA